MSKYRLRKGITLQEYNKVELAKKIGITRQTLYNITNGKPTNKPVAYMITKILNSDKEIEYFFERI